MAYVRVANDQTVGPLLNPKPPVVSPKEGAPMFFKYRLQRMMDVELWIHGLWFGDEFCFWGFWNRGLGILSFAFAGLKGLAFIVLGTLG